MQNYDIVSAIDNRKGEPDEVQYYVEPSDGGGIEFTGLTLEQAEAYIKGVGGKVANVL